MNLYSKYESFYSQLALQIFIAAIVIAKGVEVAGDIVTNAAGGVIGNARELSLSCSLLHFELGFLVSFVIENFILTFILMAQHKILSFYLATIISTDFN